MSVPGSVFTIITNNGIQDKLIMASEKLTERMSEISKSRLCQLRSKYPGLSDKEIVKKDYSWMPTLASIEQTHIVFVNSTFKPYVSVAHEYSKCMARGASAQLGHTVTFTMPVIGEFVSDIALHVRLEGLAAADPNYRVRYVEMLGHKLMKQTSFKHKQLELDAYTPERYNTNWQFKVPVNKELGYLRNIGQEVPKQAYVTADPTTDEHREYKLFGDGPQTFKTSHDAVDMWIPLLFWFKDVQSALPNFLLRYGQTDIDITFESEANLVSYSIPPGSPAPYYTVPRISKCELYLNHIFIDPAFYNIFVKRFGFQLIRVNRTHITKNITSSENSIRLHQLKWPVESMYVAFRPQSNASHSQKWHRNTAITDRTVKVAVVTPPATLGVNDAVYYDEAPILQELGLKLHDTVIYPVDLPPAFYHSYLPTQYGRGLKAPRDIGWNMMNFNFYPGEFQPSGYINTSQGREFYLYYKSAIDEVAGQPYIRPDNPVDLIIVADCINFLLVKDDGMILRFMT